MPRALVTGLFAAALGVAGCGENPFEVSGPKAPVDPSAPPPPIARWSLMGGNPVALVLQGGDDAVVRLACLRDPARLKASVTDAIVPIASEERFTIGAGDEAFALVADLRASNARFLEATGDPPADLIDRIERGDPISISYGAQTIGPLPTIPEAHRKAFATDCRDISAPSV